MIDPEVKKLLEELAVTAQGKALKKYLKDQIEFHTDINKLTELPQLLGAQIAVKILKDIFCFLEEKEKQIKSKDRNQYI